MCLRSVFSDVEKTGETDFVEKPQSIVWEIGCTQTVTEYQSDSFWAGRSQMSLLFSGTDFDNIS